jgi:hypothetical protein
LAFDGDALLYLVLDFVRAFFLPLLIDPSNIWAGLPFIKLDGRR